MNTKNIKNIYFDLDGTLLDENKVLNKEKIKILDQLKLSGYNIGIITGRAPFMIKHYKNLVKPNLPIVGVNGAIISDENLDLTKPKYEEYISSDSSNEIVNKLISMGVVFLLYTKDSMYYSDPRMESPWIKWVRSTLDDFPLNEKWDFIKVENKNTVGLKTLKILVISGETSKEKMDNISEFIDGIKRVYSIKSQNNVFDIMPMNQSKGNALEWIENNSSLVLEETMVFGDADNDISMMKVAGISIAMLNANENVKTIADGITEFDNNNGGIEEFLTKHFIKSL